MKGNPIIYSEDELRWIKAHKSQPRKPSHMKFVKIFNRPDVTLKNYCALCNRNGWVTGRGGRFQIGHEAWNKDKKSVLKINSESLDDIFGDLLAEILQIIADNDGEVGVEVLIEQAMKEADERVRHRSHE
jgi:hypothetical protein